MISVTNKGHVVDYSELLVEKTKKNVTLRSEVGISI